ncbi:MAG: HEAT repeat domain-containing protein [Limnoraphis robusta]|jgi:HEAT repeat protein|uniref:Phycocyanin alpha phycocyanobilin lyase n=2 Tax=Limnoraphis robusta TaxID=1118279 RepID=A0A0F5YF37_9CYAN|nr:HEAT repeat domain-containing protein [Limnoraphis robusta]KKD37242.1 phycocyanin alpha phycocyanobilin lyase [Limnoraphis robusta CS-951]MEA5518296.1 HEAT repeat domain-containing protein [Limnoraphis robusta CCNP1315]MEA5545834.1 HEAT repeat domain-containing protein [Limnoraphis robusta CCNP1324]
MSITPESVQQLLSSEDLGDRLRGVNQLRQLEPETAFALIQSAVADRDTRVRYAAVSQLSTLGEQDRTRALQLLRECLLQDPEADVKAAAADAIGGLKLREAFDELEQVYHNTSEWLIKLSIVAALAELGEPRGFELLEDALKGDNDLIRTVAIGAMGELGDRRAIPLLLPYAGDPDWQIRHRVAQALVHLGASPEAEETLKQLASDQVEAVAQAAQRLDQIKS